ncbi:hypothetical protein BH11MYX2_BH11MYX2_23630 [soil metagenome]
MKCVLLALLLASCSGDTPAGSLDDATVGDSMAPLDTPADAGSGLAPGSLTVSWMHGSQSCNANTDPELQTHEYNATTVIFRQNKCDTFEAPFIYLIIGTDSALLLDTGATNTPALRTAVRAKIGNKPLIVAHTHSHGDHVAGDPQFTGQPNTTLVGTTTVAVYNAFGITASAQGTKDLGGRMLDVFAIPGHQAQHIAVYDRQTGILFTGDTLYPGLLFISDWTAYRDSVGKMLAFAQSHPIAYVLGAHVEMTTTPKQVYPYGTTYQPNEHVLQLPKSSIDALSAAVTQLGANPPNGDVPYDDFVISPQ